MKDRIGGHLRALRDELATLDIGLLPSVPIVGWDDLDLPVRTTAVYFLVSRSKGLLYIGRATNMRVRWRVVYAIDNKTILEYQTHSQFGPAIALGDVSLHWLEIPREFLAAVESVLLQIHTPPWNNHQG